MFVSDGWVIDKWNQWTSNWREAMIANMKSMMYRKETEMITEESRRRKRRRRRGEGRQLTHMECYMFMFAYISMNIQRFRKPLGEDWKISGENSKHSGKTKDRKVCASLGSYNVYYCCWHREFDWNMPSMRFQNKEPLRAISLWERERTMYGYLVHGFHKNTTCWCSRRCMRDEERLQKYRWWRMSSWSLHTDESLSLLLTVIRRWMVARSEWSQKGECFAC